MEFTDLFAEDHKAIRRALDVLKTMTDRAEHGTAPDPHDVNALLIFLHYFGDVCHQSKEESILFAALRSPQEFPSRGVSENLLQEHHEERSLIERAQLVLFTDQQDEFIRSARNVIALLSEHADKEDQILFPLAERTLTREQANDVAARIQEADAKFGCAQRALLLDLLESLETKYLRWAA